MLKVDLLCVILASGILLEIEEWLPHLRLCVTSNSHQSTAGSEGVCSRCVSAQCVRGSSHYELRSLQRLSPSSPLLWGGAEGTQWVGEHPTGGDSPHYQTSNSLASCTSQGCATLRHQAPELNGISRV